MGDKGFRCEVFSFRSGQRRTENTLKIRQCGRRVTVPLAAISENLKPKTENPRLRRHQRIVFHIRQHFLDHIIRADAFGLAFEVEDHAVS